MKLAARAAAGAGADEDVSFPLLDQRPIRRVELILVTPDRGLTGALNSNVIRRASRYILNEAGAPVSIIAVGRKGRDFMLRYGREVVAEFTGLGDYPTLNQVTPITQIAVDDFVNGRVDAVFVVYSRFISTMTQTPDIQQVLPVQPPSGDDAAARAANFIFEPSPEEVPAAILPRYVAVQIYQAILESLASEHGARMIAMHNATENAKDIVRSLTLTYNKARQAGITKEILEIAGGAEALREAS